MSSESSLAPHLPCLADTHGDIRLASQPLYSKGHTVGDVAERSERQEQRLPRLHHTAL